MNYKDYKAKFTAWATLTEQRLGELCDEFLPPHEEIAKAARYSLLGGGKRIRAVLTLAACQLAADALVTAAFEVIAHADLPAESRVEAAAILAKGGGARGMLYGQELDKHYETVRATEDQLLELHRNKTGALIIAAVELGCTAANAAPALRKALVQYAAEVGLVFQIVDDILDVTSTTEELGKPVGSDADNDKTTFITLYGLDGARALAKQHNDAALAALDGFGAQEDFLRLLAGELLQRKK